MAVVRRAGRGLRNGGIVGRFEQIFSFCARIAYCGGELADEFLFLQPLLRGYGGRGRPQWVEILEVYATVASLDDSTIIFILRRYRLQWS